MDPFLGEIRIIGFNFAPRNWAFCNGQILPIAQNTALFSLLGTTYGGNGQTTFALPNLQSRAPMHAGQGPGLTDRGLGEQGGEENVTLLTVQMPSHNHPMLAGTRGNQTSPIGFTWGSSTAVQAYSPTSTSAMSPVALSPAGGSQPHNNIQPYLGVNIIIAMSGVFPARN